MFLPEGDDHRYHRVRLVRDIVEVLAIIAAGCWAFYVFAYENRIKPSLAQPEVIISAALHKVSLHGGLIGVRLELGTQNVGSVNAHFIGYSANVYGQTVTALASPQPPVMTPLERPDAVTLNAFYRLSEPTLVYTSAYLTALSDPKVGADSELDPGGSQHFEQTFYVPANRFDKLGVYIDALYTKAEDRFYPATLARGKFGYKIKTSPGPWIQFSATVTSLDLHGP